jgi:putative acetyltransferase
MDTSSVRAVHRAAFGGDHGVLVAGLVEDLLRDPAALSLTETADGVVIGHVMFTRGLLDAPERLVEVQVLSPLAVLPGHQRRGTGGRLVRRGLDVLERRGVPLVFLEGDPAYYSRHGFVPAGPLGFRKPSLRIPDAAFQVRTLSAYRPWMTGTLVYPQVFWDHDAVGLR